MSSTLESALAQVCHSQLTAAAAAAILSAWTRKGWAKGAEAEAGEGLRLSVGLRQSTTVSFVCVYVCVFVCAYVCVFVCVYVCVYAYSSVSLSVTECMFAVVLGLWLTLAPFLPLASPSILAGAAAAGRWSPRAAAVPL